MTYPYTEGRQLERYIEQFSRIFSGFQLPTGDRDSNGEQILKKVPVTFGAPSRIVASLISKNDGKQNITLPIIATNLTGLQQNPLSRKPMVHVDEIAVNDSDYIQRISGPPLILDMEVNLFTSSIFEMFCLLEQILLVFNQRIRIQISNDIDVSEYATQVELTNIASEVSYPISQNSRIVQYTLNFEIQATLRYPKGFGGDLIQKIVSNTIVKDADFDGEVGDLVIENMIPEETDEQNP